MELQPLAIRALHVFKAGGWTDIELGLFATTTTTLFAHKLVPHIAGRAGRYAVYVMGLLGVLAIWVVYLNLCIVAIYGLETSAFALDGAQVLKLYAVVAAAVGGYTMLTVDLNATGIHKFYRDRLSKAYIVGFEKVASAQDRKPRDYRLDHTDTVKLSELDTRHAPYHLINTVVNLAHPDKAYQRGRRGDFFIFSKRFIGGEVTGYCPTEKMERTSRALDLATAMAISGAAAAANMGKKTVKPLVFVLAMLNVRLNYWLPNPRRMSRAPWSRVGPLYLLWEMAGNLTANSLHVNLSDGGHIENLGIYELLRRECRFIIAGDGEADPRLEFEGLADAVRMALIDFGISITLDGLDELRRGEQHYAIGTIHYRNGRIGKLIYLKSSLPDDRRLFDRNAYIGHYKSLHRLFPHESTSDQFFDEAQFECYRALGYEVAMTTLGRRL